MSLALVVALIDATLISNIVSLFLFSNIWLDSRGRSSIMLYLILLNLMGSWSMSLVHSFLRKTISRLNIYRISIK